MSRDHHPALRDVTADTDNTPSSIVARAYFGRDLEMVSLYCCVLEHVYGTVAWQWVFTLQYIYMYIYIHIWPVLDNG
jgi:hypothetical protein